jgi:2-dehydropantoate 2-reductase
MNIVIFGAGAIGSLFGAFLDSKNDVTLIARPDHVNIIKKKGLTIQGKTKLTCNISAEENLDKLDKKVELIILTVKSYDTAEASKKISNFIDSNTIVLTIQNGLDNIEKIKSEINSKNIITGTTTHGAYLSEPGVVFHSGFGDTILGELNGETTDRLNMIIKLFNGSSIKTNISKNIIKEIWIKAIINSGINPLTTIFNCKNGYLLKNPILETLLEKICTESTEIAIKNGINIQRDIILKKTKKVARNTHDNYSSMLQSYLKGKKTEIESINGKILEIAAKYNYNAIFNKLLIEILNS